jgi:hypothetical protein
MADNHTSEGVSTEPAINSGEAESALNLADKVADNETELASSDAASERRSQCKSASIPGISAAVLGNKSNDFNGCSFL